MCRNEAAAARLQAGGLMLLSPGVHVWVHVSRCERVSAGARLPVCTCECTSLGVNVWMNALRSVHDCTTRHGTPYCFGFVGKVCQLYWVFCPVPREGTSPPSAWTLPTPHQQMLGNLNYLAAHQSAEWRSISWLHLILFVIMGQWKSAHCFILFNPM